MAVAELQTEENIPFLSERWRPPANHAAVPVCGLQVYRLHLTLRENFQCGHIVMNLILSRLQKSIFTFSYLNSRNLGHDQVYFYCFMWSLNFFGPDGILIAAGPFEGFPTLSFPTAASQFFVDFPLLLPPLFTASCGIQAQ